MKKLITLLSLTMAMTAFGAPQGNTDKEGKMNITAEVIQPLTVTADKDMDFGKVIQGNTATAESKFIITGESGENITVTIPEKVTLSNTKSNQNKLNVLITKRGLSTTNLGPSGSIEIPVYGLITPTKENTPTGTYTGEFTAQVRYN